MPFCSGNTAGSIHRGCPRNGRHGGFHLLCHQPGLVHPSLGNLLTPSSPGTTMLVPAERWTPVQHRAPLYRTPELRQLHSLSLPDAWTTDTRHRARRGLHTSKEYTKVPSFRSVTEKTQRTETDGCCVSCFQRLMNKCMIEQHFYHLNKNKVSCGS